MIEASSLTLAMSSAIQSTLSHTATPEAVQASQDLIRGSDALIVRWTNLNLAVGTRGDFSTVHGKLALDLSEADVQALNIYLSLHSGTIAENVLLWNDTAHEEKFSAVQAMAGAALLANLMKPEMTEPEARKQTLIEMQRLTPEGAAAAMPPSVATPVADKASGPHPEVQRYLHEIIERSRKELAERPTTPVVRLMARVYHDVNRFCRDQGLPNHLRNVSIGDVDPAKLPPDVREALALDPFGPKARAVSALARSYEQLTLRGGTDVLRYDIPALGLPPLRQHFVDYAKLYALYAPHSSPAESMIAAGGGQGLSKALLAARLYFRETAGIANPEVLFPNPGLRMLAANTRDLGFTVHEPQAQPENGFFMTADEADAYLDAHPEIKIYVNTPMGNPNGGITDADHQEGLMEVMRRRGILVINDFAYLGTGDQERTLRVGKTLSTYSHRIDVIPMTKIFGRPGLRCCGVLTPDNGIAARFMPLAQNYQPTESYAMQTEALALWQVVTQKDRLAFTRHMARRQEQIVHDLGRRNAARIAAGEKPLLDPSRPVISGASLYVLVPLAEGIDPFTVVEETGLVGVPAAGFFASGQQGWMRFSVGMEELD